jgi:3-hydroxyisobutyrate dehydrogenase-like beta-hydroxyacid dehydrogenase
MTASRIALVGFGEVGRTLATDLQRLGIASLTAWDRLFPDPTSTPSLGLTADQAVVRASTLGGAVAGADLIIGAVTAGECLNAVREAARSIAPGAVWLDLNSVAPATKITASKIVADAGGRFVEAAVMSPIAPEGLRSPMLLSGPFAENVTPSLHALGFTGARFCSADYGVASATKMCRSVIIKGIEALLAESLLAARHYGVEGAVLSSLQDLLPGHDWPTLAKYMISRSLLHGRRRAEEMREAARTVEDARVSAWMSRATVERQSWAGRHQSVHAMPNLGELLAILRGRSDIHSGMPR